MADDDPKLRLLAAPFAKKELSTPRLMMDVIVALLPLCVGAVYFFGLGALLILLASTLGAMATEWAFRGRHALGDGTAALTGVILGLTLPPGLPLWMAFLGGVVAIGLGKLVWGGLGQNLFNPALVGRAFLQAAFPISLTTWVAPRAGVSEIFSVPASNLALPFMKAQVDAVSTATPLAMMKFEHKSPDVVALLTGRTAGSLGETSAILILVGGLYLLLRRAFDWRIPVGILLAAGLGAAAFHLIAPAKYPAPWLMLLSGGLLFGAVFMATDPVTSPLSPRGTWIFAIGIGLLVVIIRLFGGLPEGVMYAILLMNAATPLIDRYSQPRAFGRRRSGEASG